MRRIAVALIALVVAVGCSKEEPKPVLDSYVYEPVRTAGAFISMVEKPDASRALLIGAAAKALAPVFERAGVKAFTRIDGRFDIVVVDCGDMSSAACNRVVSCLTENGIVSWMMDVRGLTASRFRARLKSFSLESFHLWMPGADQWVVVGRNVPRQIKLSAMLDVFNREGLFEDLSRANCETLPEVFANYVGERQDVMPAFAALESSAEIRAENFITKDVRPVAWISSEGMDEDIASSVLAEIRSMQVVRRLVAEGNLIASSAASKKDEERATESWARAALRNPNDLMLLERIDRLGRNARGFLEVGKLLQAMKCYETMVLIRPNDASAVHNFGMCLKKVGKADLAEQVLSRAKKLLEGKTGL